MTPQTLPADPPIRATWVLVLALLWVLAFALLSVTSIVYNCRLDGPPGLFSDLFPVAVGALVAGLYCLIRQL